MTRVFISYSHESDEHKAWVLALADRLRGDGVDAWIDRYADAPVEGWPRWIRRQIDEAEFVVCVCTPAYRRAFEGHHDPERGLGVNNEGFIILQDLYDNGNVSERYVPVVPRRPGSSWSQVPGSLRGFTIYELPGDYEQVLRRLQGAGIAVPPLPALSETGYPAQDRVSAYLRPEDHALERLAPHDGLFLSRLINPVAPLDPTIVMTVWIAARGDRQYILDSTRIYNEWTGGAGPLVSVAVPPDAAYHFAFRDHSDEVHPLDPALSVGPETRRTASFTFSAAPDASLYGFSRLWIWVRYHTTDGRSGSLVLEDPPEGGKVLARLLGRDVEIGLRTQGDEVVRMAVSPEGLQRGLDEGAPPELSLSPFEEIHHRWRWSPRASLVDYRAACRDELARRAPLNRALAAADSYSVLGRHLAAGAVWAADVLGGIADDKATATLLDRLSEKPDDEAAFRGLCVRHLVHPDHVLLDQLRTEVRRSFKARDTAKAVMLVTADVAGRTSSIDDWIAAYETLSYQTEWHAVPGLLHGDLPAQWWRRICDHAGGPLGDELYVRGSMHGWAGPPPGESLLRHGGDDRYRATLRLDPGVHTFKVSDRNWSHDRNSGGREPGEQVTLQSPHHLYADQRSHDLTLDLTGESAARNYSFEIDATDPASPMVSVSPR